MEGLGAGTEPVQAANGGDARSALERCQRRPGPTSAALCAKLLPAAGWRVQALSDCPQTSNFAQPIPTRTNTFLPTLT